MDLSRLAFPLLRHLDPETAHRLTVWGLAHGFGPAQGEADDPVLRCRLWGHDFPNPVGIAAGFDKNGEAFDPLLRAGFGFTEVGTVTPRPQAGNPRPRLFRLAEDSALINRMGFNNAGAAALARRVMLARRHLPASFAVGVNIGRGRETSTDRAVEDYLAAYRLIAPVADYVAINVSSPNTPGLRDLQDPDRLSALLGELDRAGQQLGSRPPLVVKLAPDIPDPELEAIVERLAGSAAGGLILANTSIRRPWLRSPQAPEEGGLSGAPLLAGTLRAVATARRVAGRRLVLIASGGLASGSDIAAAYLAGADLVQLWTGLVYRGPGLVGEAAGVPFQAGPAGW